MGNNIKTNLKEFSNKTNSTLRGVLLENINKDKDYIVLMLGGFERAGTTERKFKSLADKLAENKIDSFRFDATDCGLSDGDFYNMTTDSLASDLQSAVDFVKKLGYTKISVVVHSLAACALTSFINEKIFTKIILIAPALNQAELLRLWFAQTKNKNITIDWHNYKKYYTENEFTENLKLDLITKFHKLSANYKILNQNIDYASYFNAVDKNSILLIHGTADNKVPLESINIDFNNKIIIKNGDHDLESPGVIEQWLDKTIEFLKIK